MTISVIIATRNRGAALRATLESLGRVAKPDGAGVEIILVDNGSTDDTPAVARAARPALGAITVFEDARAGKANALNTALLHATGDVLVFLDDDIRARPDWLRALVRPIASGRVDAVSGRIDIAPHLQRPWMTAMLRSWLASTENLDPQKPDSAIGANMAIARRVLRRVPQFDPELGPGQLGFWEDTLFSLQLRRAGFQLGYASDAVVEHHFDPARLSHASLLEHAIKLGRSSAYVARHWEHSDPQNAFRDALHYRLRLLAKRFLQRRECQREEGIVPWEVNLICGIAYADQLRAESAREPAYDRFGLIKRTPELTPASR